MGTEQRIVAGLTHVDVGWKKGEAEMDEIFDIYVLRLIDLLEQYPDFHYLLEQTIHYRKLKDRRPDLFLKVKRYVQEGRLEFVTGLITTIENNVTNGESFIRNMQIGLHWLYDNFGIRVNQCVMIDTFGFPPQMPQVLNLFGFKNMFGSRFGSSIAEDAFVVEGLDGTELLVAGKDQQAPYIKSEYVVFRYYSDRKDLDDFFDYVEKESDFPILVVPYSENEVVPLTYILEKMKKGNCQFHFGTMEEFFHLLELEREKLKHRSADLNPELSGTFSLRHILRIKNRNAEFLVLELEKLAAWYHSQEAAGMAEELWWEMAYVQFHDLITGSHPTEVYEDCLKRYEKIIQTCHDEIQRILVPDSTGEPGVFTVWNGLPWQLKDEMRLSLPEHWNGISEITVNGRLNEQYWIDNEEVVLKTELLPMSATVIQMKEGSKRRREEKRPINVLENTYIRLEFDQSSLIHKLIYKPAETVIAERIDDLLVIQRDRGNFQIEEPIGSELLCGSGNYDFELYQEGHVQYAIIKGEFPPFDGVKTPYKIKISLPEDKPYFDITIWTKWDLEEARMRLKLNTLLGAVENYYEVPFGVIERKPYGIRTTAKGEWPVHRFAVMENSLSELGIALLNRGTVGVEAAQGILKSTLLRAPVCEYAGMVKDETSSDHGEHLFEFRAVCYQGSWRDAGIAAYAQVYNQPPLLMEGKGTEIGPVLSYKQDRIILSGIRRIDNEKTAVRLYETTGSEITINPVFSGKYQVWESDLNENKIKYLGVSDKTFKLSFRPFEIKTLLLEQMSSN